MPKSRIGREPIAAVVCALGLFSVTAVVLAAVGDTMVSPVEVNAAARIAHHELIDPKMLAPGAAAASAGGTTSFSTADGAVRVGVWESDPTTLRLDLPIIEYVHVVEGSAVIHDESGHSWTYKPGDSFVLPQGFNGTATLIGHFKKEFVDVRPSGPTGTPGAH